MEKYEHILNILYNKSTKRKQMSLNDRAAQFAPFAALTGYEESIAETGRLTDKQITLNQQAKELISKKLNYIIDNKISFFNDYKSILQEAMQTDKRSFVYEVIGESGPSHDKTFTVQVKIDNIVYGKGSAGSKKEACQMAAKDTLEKLARN